MSLIAVAQWDYSWPLSTLQTVGLIVGILSVVLASYFNQSRILATAFTGRSTRTIRLVTLIVLRLAALLILVWMLAGVQRVDTEQSVAPVQICIDTSESMSVVQEGKNELESQSRLQQSLAVADALNQAIKDAYQKRNQSGEIEILSIGDSLVATTLVDLSRQFNQATNLSFAKTSKLGDNLNQLALKSNLNPPACVVLLSDGRVTAGDSLAQVDLTRWNAAQQNNSPIRVFSLMAGEAPLDQELSIDPVQHASLIFVGDEVELRTNLHSVGLQDSQVQVQLRDAIGQAIGPSQNIDITANQQVDSLKFEYLADRVGDIKLQLSAITVASSTTNFKQPVAIDQTFALTVRDKPIQILLVSQGYSYETRFLKHFLQRQRRSAAASEPVFQTTILISEAEDRLVQSEAEMISYLQVQAEWWQQFDACIFIDPSPGIIDAQVAASLQQAIAAESLGLIFVAGNINTASEIEQSVWQQLLPVISTNSKRQRNALNSQTESATTWQLTSGAIASGFTLNRDNNESSEWTLPPLRWNFASTRGKPTARILLENVGRSSSMQTYAIAVASHFFGAGQVAFQSSDETYKWRNYGGSDALYQQYWNDLIALVAKKTSSNAAAYAYNLELAQQSYKSGVTIDVGVVNRMQAGSNPPSPELLLSSDENQLQRIALGGQIQSQRTKSSLENLSPGTYQLQVVEKQNSGESRIEQANRSQTPLSEAVKFTVEPPLTEMTNTQADFSAMIELSQRSGGAAVELANWRTLLDRIAQPDVLYSRKLPPESIWNLSWIVVVVMSLLTTEWYLRNRWGLI